MSAARVPFDPEAFLKHLTTLPGVYRMLDGEGTVIYVGKARNLKKRVSSYFRRGDQSPKTQALVAQIQAIEVTVTHTENEALLLEHNLIKQHQPRYNILLRDDKSYPYIFLSDDEYPRLGYHRGKRREKGRYFGPYPSAVAARETLHLLQRLFHVRQCEDTYFRNRNRPCLQYQIKRCSGPCLPRLIAPERYAEDVRHTVMSLEGRNNQVVDELVAAMEAAAGRLDFEAAAGYRDQIAHLRRVQERQYVNAESGDVDVVAAASEGGVGCVQIFFIRGGHNLGNKTFYPQNTGLADDTEILSAFLSQYYLASEERPVPREIIVNGELPDAELLEGVLSGRAGHRVAISSRVRAERARWREMAEINARAALASHLASKASMLNRFEALRELLDLDAVPERLECFDVSHTMGEATVASCVVFHTDGPAKSDYRRFNIENVPAGDDYGAMRQALTRRYKRLKEGEGRYPDVLFIDGGKGQVTQAREVLETLQVTGVTLVGVAKGPSRKAGLEQLILSDHNAPIALPPDSPALLLIQQIRDEAHRFAIAGHRQRRGKVRTTSVLEGIPGLGSKRRQMLLRQFGGLQEVARAGVEDLTKVHGISRQIAQRIYDHFHPDGP